MIRESERPSNHAANVCWPAKENRRGRCTAGKRACLLRKRQNRFHSASTSRLSSARRNRATVVRRAAGSQSSSLWEDTSAMLHRSADRRGESGEPRIVREQVLLCVFALFAACDDARQWPQRSE